MLETLKKKFGISGGTAAVLGILGLTTLAMSLPDPVMSLYLESNGIQPVLIGTMLSVCMFGMAIGEVGWGWLADRIGIRSSMITGTFFSGLSVLLFVLTTNVPAVFGIFFLWGFLRSAVFGPGRGFIGQAAPPQKKATFMALSAVMLSASRSLGALPSGFMVDGFGYNSVFYASFGASVLGGLIVLFSFRAMKTNTGTLPKEVSPDITADVPQPKFNLFALTPQCVVTALRFFGMGGQMTFLPLFATQIVGIDIKLVGVLFTVSGLVNVALAIPMGLLADRLGKKTLMVAGIIVSIVSLIGIAFSGNFGWLLFFVVINSIGMVMFSPAALGLFSDSVPAHRQSTAMGFYGGVCENVGILGGSALGGVLWDTLGPESTFFMGAISSALAAIVCLTMVKTVKSGC